MCLFRREWAHSLAAQHPPGSLLFHLLSQSNSPIPSKEPQGLEIREILHVAEQKPVSLNYPCSCYGLAWKFLFSFSKGVIPISKCEGFNVYRGCRYPWEIHRRINMGLNIPRGSNLCFPEMQALLWGALLFLPTVVIWAHLCHL